MGDKQRDEQKFEIANKAEKLYFSVFDYTTNRQHYPVRFRRLGDRLQEYALDIHSDLLDANSFTADTIQHKAKRYELKTSAITKCNKFLSLTKYSLHAHLISFATSEAWTELVNDIKFMTLAWRKNCT